MEMLIGVAIGLVVGAGVMYFFSRMQFGGSASYSLGLRIARKAFQDPAFAAQAENLLVPPPPAKPSGEAVRILALLQTEARLVDFLMDNLSGADDGQVAAVVRELQPKAQASLKKYLTLEPVMPQPDQSEVTVSAGFDPSAIRLVGNVTGQPPFRGKLTHGGWKVRALHISKPPEGADQMVLMPAEVELA